MSDFYVSKNLLNNEKITLREGSYVFSVSGAMDVQWDLGNGKGFVLFTDSVFVAAEDVILDLPSCAIKIINAGANELFISQTK